MLAWSTAVGIAPAGRGSLAGVRRSGPLSVDLVGGPNWAAFVAILSEGGYVIYRGVGLTCGEYQTGGGRGIGVVRADIVSEWQSGYLTEERALADLERGKSVIGELLAESAEVRELVQHHGLQYQLIDDYGNGSLLIAREKNGNLEWSYTPWQRQLGKDDERRG